MPLKIRYGTQGACADLPSAFLTVAIFAHQAGADGARLGGNSRIVLLFAPTHAPRSLEHQKGGFPLRGTAEKPRLEGRRPQASQPTDGVPGTGEGAISRCGVVARSGRRNR